MRPIFLKVYRTAQAVYVGLLVYVVVLPLMVPYIRRIAPGFWRCTYETLYHRPCPFCGTTTYLYRFFVYGEALPAYLVVPALILMEEAVRHAYLFCRLWKPYALTPRGVVVDAVCTFAALGVVLLCFLW